MTATKQNTVSSTRLQAVEALLDRKRMLILYAGYYLALIAVVLRGIDYYFLQEVEGPLGQGFRPDGYEQRWLVLGLLVIFSIGAIARHWLPRSSALSHALVAGLSAIAFSLLFIEPGQDFFAILFFLLSLQAMLSFRLLVGYLWILVFAVLSAIGILVENGFMEGISLTLVYTAGFYFFGSFSASTAQSERARQDAEETLEALKLREAELSQTSRTLQTLIDASPLAIVMLDRNAQIVMRNSAAEAIFGWTEEEMLGRSPDDLAVSSDLTHEFRSKIDQLKKGESPGVVETQRTRKDGSVIDVSIWTAPLRDEVGQVAGIVAFLADISDRKRAEADLLQSEERYRRLVEESPDAIVVFDERGNLVDANVGACEKLGYSHGELERLNLRDIYPDFDELHLARLQTHFDAPLGDDHFHLEDLELMKRDGSRVPVEAHLAAIEIEGERHFIAIVRDVTERKQAEAALLSQTRELAVLEERNRLAREMHDTLAQGFTGIVLQLEAAEQALEDNAAADEVARHLTTAKALARESLQEARRSVWNLRPSALTAGSLEEALRLEVSRLQGQGIDAALEVIDLPSELGRDIEAALLRVCQEALTNVRRHSGAAKVKVELSGSRGTVVLAVKDDGRGFEAEPDPRAGGLGLRGMRERLGLLGGELEVESAPGNGTTIVARVDLRPQAVNA